MNTRDPRYGWNFDNTYTKLPEAFFARVGPTPVELPKIAILNRALAKDLGLEADALAKQPGFFSGNTLPPGAEPIAQAYAGHQFAHFTMLGDGRADLLGEHVTPKGERFDIQLKGSGPTPFSRRGDGRAALGPMLREYIISEAMFALGIPTTRSLAVATTGEMVYRETLLPGAVLTRVAASHIRVGTFEYAAATRKPELLKALADYTIERHYPALKSEREPYVALLTAVIEKQAPLIAQWMLNGFIHGVMNTDNMALSGETIDYGPCAFMDEYSLSTVFSSIDSHGRYAYGNQPSIAEWNLTRLAEALLPLFSEKEEEAIEKAQAALGSFHGAFERHWVGGLREKLGLTSGEVDLTLIESLLKLMAKHQPDYTNLFRALTTGDYPNETLYQDPDFTAWHAQWFALGPDKELMRRRNPVVIPRNHRVEEALSAAVERNDYSVMEKLLGILAKPFDETPENVAYRQPPATGRGDYQTFCGT